jgi:hypothetical protein
MGFNGDQKQNTTRIARMSRITQIQTNEVIFVGGDPYGAATLILQIRVIRKIRATRVVFCF